MFTQGIWYQRAWKIEAFFGNRSGTLKTSNLTRNLYFSTKMCLLKGTGKLGCKQVATPIEYNNRLCNASEDSVVDKGLYQRLVEKLITCPIQGGCYICCKCC